MEERDFEQEARAEGWVPKEEFKGDESKWVDAETFVKRGEEILPIVNAKNRKLVGEIEELQKTVEELKLGNSQFREFHEKEIEKQKRQRDEAIRELEAARKKAITDGDGEAFEKADKALSEVKSEPDQKNQLSDDQKAWLAENRWYEEDDTLQAVADGLSGVLAKRRPDLVGKRAFLDELTKLVREEMPHKFENPNRQKQTVEDSRPKGKTGGGKTLDDMPEADRKTFERFKKTIPGFDLERAVKNYFEDQIANS